MFGITIRSLYSKLLEAKEKEEKGESIMKKSIKIPLKEKLADVRH